MGPLEALDALGAKVSPALRGGSKRGKPDCPECLELFARPPAPVIRRSADPRSGAAVARVTVAIWGERQIATFEAMCEATGRKPHELAGDIVVEEMWEAQDGRGKMGRLARQQRRWRLERFAEVVRT